MKLDSEEAIAAARSAFNSVTGEYLRRHAVYFDYFDVVRDND